MVPFWFYIKQTKLQILKHICPEAIGILQSILK